MEKNFNLSLSTEVDSSEGDNKGNQRNRNTNVVERWSGRGSHPNENSLTLTEHQQTDNLLIDLTSDSEGDHDFSRKQFERDCKLAIHLSLLGKYKGDLLSISASNKENVESTATSPVSPEIIDLLDTPEKATCSLQEMLKEIERPSGSNNETEVQEKRPSPPPRSRNNTANMHSYAVTPPPAKRPRLSFGRKTRSRCRKVKTISRDLWQAEFAIKYAIDPDLIDPEFSDAEDNIPIGVTYSDSDSDLPDLDLEEAERILEEYDRAAAVHHRTTSRQSNSNEEDAHMQPFVLLSPIDKHYKLLGHQPESDNACMSPPRCESPPVIVLCSSEEKTDVALPVLDGTSFLLKARKKLDFQPLLKSTKGPSSPAVSESSSPEMPTVAIKSELHSSNSSASTRHFLDILQPSSPSVRLKLGISPKKKKVPTATLR